MEQDVSQAIKQVRDQVNGGSLTLSALTTIDQSCLVNALNEVKVKGAQLTSANTFTNTNTFNARTYFFAGTATLPSIAFSGDTNTGFYSPAADTLAVTTAGAAGLVQFPSGNVAIGTLTDNTAYGGAKLHVVGTGSSASTWRGRVVAGGDNAKFLMGEYNNQAWLGAHNGALSAWSILCLNPQGGADVFIGYDGTTLNPYTDLIVGGKVGVGIAAPLSKLHVAQNSAANVQATVENQYAGYNAAMQIKNTTRDWFFHVGGSLSATPGQFSFIDNTAATTRMSIDTSGRVGMGTEAPSARVHAVSTTEQLRVGYDSSNYVSFTVGSTGGVTMGGAGAATDKWTFTANTIHNGTANRMPNQTVATADSVLTRDLERKQRQLLDAYDNWDFYGSLNGMSSGGAAGTGAYATQGQAQTGTAIGGWARIVLAPFTTHPAGTGNNSGMSSIPLAFSVVGSFAVGNTTSCIRVFVGAALSGTPKWSNQNPLAGKGFGIEIYLVGAVQKMRLFAHDGTSFAYGTEVTFTGTWTGVCNFIVASNGAGRIQCWHAGSDTHVGLSTPTLQSTMTINSGPTSGLYADAGICMEAVGDNAIASSALGQIIRGRGMLNHQL